MSNNGDSHKASPAEEPPSSKASKALGPIQNLEAHVRPDWWRGLFNALYLKTDGDVVEDPTITRNEIDQFSAILNLSAEHRILDLCCGQGRHTLEMARRGLHYVEGLDRSQYLIGRARSRAKKEGLSVKFREGDARKLPQPADSFDVVMVMGNSFGYFDTVEDDLQVLEEIFRVLKPGGRLFLDVTDGDFMRTNFEKRSWEWIDKQHFVCRERSLSADGQRLISREVITHTEEGVLADQFYAERLYTPQSLSDLLRMAGFANIQVHGGIAPNSQRNQDLGMMAHRILVTAELDKEWTPVKAGKPRVAVKNLVVVMGDPTLPDMTKLNHCFGEVDFHTIDQLKLALKKLPQYSVTYLNTHATLLDDLRAQVGKADLVLNLCDEGYNNEARKELHVPAMLEILGLPYTGSNPQALAYCYDKSLVRGLAEQMDVPVASGVVIRPEDTVVNLPFAFPAILKPNQGDNSLGITRDSVVHNPEQLLNAVTRIRQEVGPDTTILAEKFLTGTDLTCGVIGNKTSFTVLPIGEEDYSAIPEDWPKICGYEAKWQPDSPYWLLTSKPAQLPRPTEKIIAEGSLRMFERLELRDYARFDWRLDAEGNPHLLEANPNPGWCWDGHLAKMAGLAGHSYPEMLGMILKAAEQRIQQNGHRKPGRYKINIEYLRVKQPEKAPAASR
ncbi:MAG: methyltransferase domain-containing protein [Chloroflexi bacterium]|nr:methyltransferase domain-containing protein [Chloroflexota bacterium]